MIALADVRRLFLRMEILMLAVFQHHLLDTLEKKKISFQLENGLKEESINYLNVFNLLVYSMLL